MGRCISKMVGETRDKKKAFECTVVEGRGIFRRVHRRISKNLKKE
jgi:hypothetical protein